MINEGSEKKRSRVRVESRALYTLQTLSFFCQPIISYLYEYGQTHKCEGAYTVRLELAVCLEDYNLRVPF